MYTVIYNKLGEVCICKNLFEENVHLLERIGEMDIGIKILSIKKE